MKKLLLSLLICMGITMISTQTFAQLDADGAKLKPFVGNTYTYTFNGITDGLDYEFYISTSNVGVGAVDAARTAYITSTTGTVSSNKAETTIAWPALAATDVEVYLFVKISGTGTCDNYNAVGITPIANAFNLAIADNTPGTISEESCPTTTGLKAVVAPTSNPAYIYDAGTTTLTYEFTKSGNTNNWNLDFDIVQTGTGDYSYTFNGSTTPIAVDNGTTNVAVNGLTSNTQTLTITVNNVPGQTPVFVLSTNSVVDAVTSVSPGTLPADLIHTIKLMPVIGSFN
ncbi:hypothetical protein [Ancylomarina sp.]|uniref:hypothetical protein n=1 Tax=Ancylomarina sp. TaxID=1970196 RepID=UPI0035648512